MDNPKKKTTKPIKIIRGKIISYRNISMPVDNTAVVLSKPIYTIQKSGGSITKTAHNPKYLTQEQSQELWKAILTIIKEGWDHPIVRLHTGDVASLGVGFNGIGGVGGGTSIEANWILHGKNISWLPIITVTQLIGGGFSVSATANAGVVNYLMPADSINKDRLVTNSLSGKGFAVPSAWASGGVAMGGKLGVTGTVSFDKYLNPTSIGRAVNLGFGLPTIILPIDGAIGISNTWIIYDFNN